MVCVPSELSHYAVVSISDVGPDNICNMKMKSCNLLTTHRTQHSSSTLVFLLVLLLIAISSSFHFSLLNNNRATSRQYKNINVVLQASQSSQFQVGEDVMLMDDDGATYTVGVVELKKGGWYTISLKHNSLKVKRRGSQLQTYTRQNDELPKLDTAIHNSGEGDETPSANIVDLDSILSSINQQHTGVDIVHKQLNSTSEMLPSPDTIEQIANCHSQIDKWLIFSDLHVMPSTLSTCVEVLDFVHRTAYQANAGILFLGDFWHHRGFVRVDCLNAVLDVISKWTIPSILIPGNHDQVDWKGVEHALTPLGNAYRISSLIRSEDKDTTGTGQQYTGPLIISHPTKFLDALFVPHTRDKAMMQSILSSKEAASSSALFVHADVKGASMNDLIQSQHGLSASIFPVDKCIYSGHFHKPHVVTAADHISIRYVGSPYQTSLSEAGQEKSLLLVDALNNWKCVEEIPIDIGPRYHRLSSANRLLELSSTKLRKGDKVAVSVCQQEIEEMRRQTNNIESPDVKSPFDVKLEQLRDAGITVEIRDSQTQQQDNISGTPGDDNEIELEDLSPKATLEAYIANEVESGELGEATANMILERGNDILSDIIDAIGNSTIQTSTSPSRETKVTELELESVSIFGFGSFRQEVVYPLRDRGVVLLRGTNKDFGSDSNGVGKTTLAMAGLWALAGSIDPRPTQDGKVADVVNDFSSVAQVTLRGSINSKPFIITRSKGRASSLTFSLGGSDLTQQSPKDTQVLINDHFSIESQIMLTRTIFHGQHTIGGLLESSDAKFKDELSSLVSLEIWQQSASAARSKQRELSRKASELEGMLSLREKDKMRAEMNCRSAKDDLNRRKLILEKEHQTFLQQEQSLCVDSNSSDIDRAMNSVQNELEKSNTDINVLERELSGIMDSKKAEMTKLQSDLNKKVKIEDDAKVFLQACLRKHVEAKMELESSERQLSILKREWNVGTNTNEPSLPETCQTCGQPIESPTAQKHMMERLEEKMDAAILHVDKSRDSVSIATLSYTEAQGEAEARGLEVQSCTKALHQAEEALSLETNDIQRQIKETRLLQSNLSAEFASLAKKAKQMSDAKLAKSQMQANLNRLKEALQVSVATYDSRSSELEAINVDIAELRKEKESATSAASLNTLVADTFGPKGIQAFVLRNIVQALQYCTQAYLDELSDGSLQLCMEVGPNDSIIKQAGIRDPDGTWRIRPLSSLSGGQWRRCSLSLSLGFVDLASRRGKLRSSLLVLDEPLTHLDSAGRKSVGKLLRKMLIQDSGVGSGSFGLSTILVILQEIAAEEIEECFDQIDEVIKHGGESFVILDENR